MTARNDPRYIEDARVALAMYLDTNAIGYDDGVRLAESLTDALLDTADSRDPDYLGKPAVTA